MGATSHRRLVVWVFGAALIATLVLLAAAGPAWARPITYTESQKTAEGPYSDEPTLCQDELYTTTFVGHSVEHVTYFPETRVLHFHEWSHAKVVSVPLDGTGPTYTGHTRGGHSDTYSNVERGELIRHTFFNRFVAHGSDGSRAYIKEHAHFTFNANGVKTARFEMTRMVCT